MNGQLSAEWWLVFILINLFYGAYVDPRHDKVLAIYSFEDPNDDEKEYIFCSLKCLEEYFGIEEWCVG